MGRRRIEINKIVDNTKRVATFRKRKNGLFKKALELCRLTGAELTLSVIHKQNQFTYKTKNFEKAARSTRETNFYLESGNFMKNSSTRHEVDDGIGFESEYSSLPHNSSDVEDDFTDETLEEYLRALLKEYHEHKRSQRIKERMKSFEEFDDEGLGESEADFIPTPTMPNTVEFTDKTKSDSLDAAFERAIEKLQANSNACEFLTALAAFKRQKRDRPLSVVRPQVKLEIPTGPPTPDCSQPVELHQELAPDYDDNSYALEECNYFAPIYETPLFENNNLTPIIYQNMVPQPNFPQTTYLERPGQLMCPTGFQGLEQPSPLTEILEVIRDLQKPGTNALSEGQNESPSLLLTPASTTLTELLGVANSVGDVHGIDE